MLSAHHFVATGRHSSNVDKIVVADILGNFAKFLDKGSYCFLNTPRQLDRVCSSSHNLHSLCDYGSAQDGGCGGSISGYIISFLGCLQHNATCQCASS